MNVLTNPDQHVLERISLFITSEIEPVDLSRILRKATYKLTMLSLESDEPPDPDVAEAVYYLTAMAEQLHPVMSKQ